MRNPKRKIPTGNGFLSPADGYVVYVNRIQNGEVPISIKRGKRISLDEIHSSDQLNKSSGYQIGIFMTAFSVHYNRIPLAGTIINKMRRKPEINKSTARMMANILINRKPIESSSQHLVENDRITLSIQSSGGTYVLTQIADKWISNIINDLQISDVVERGAVFGMIRFGSQVDVFLPDQLGYQPVVNTRDYVLAGESTLAIPIKKHNG